MAIKQAHEHQRGIYFITFTCHKWLPLFDITQAYALVYKWFDYLKERDHQIAGYVIMPNHLHVLIAFGRTDKSINRIVGDGKRFLAYGIVAALQKLNKAGVLQQLSAGVPASDRKRGKLHQVFEPSFDLKRCDSIDFIYQKLDYIHANPVVGKWSLAVNPWDYKYSSAINYHDKNVAAYPVTDVVDVIAAMGLGG